MGWLSGWWNGVIWWMVDGVVERMVEWGGWADVGVGWLSGCWSWLVEWMVEWDD